MKLVPDQLEAFLQFDEIVSVNRVIRAKASEIVRPFELDFDRVKAIFEWVRDHIPHTKDIGEEVVTCSAIEAFAEGTGICFPKSHLVAAMMRSEGLPCGFCYQVFENPLTADSDSLALHGLNAVYLESTERWHRIDPRGNRGEIRGGFSIEHEILAFPEMRFLDDAIYASPLKAVVDGLQRATSITALWPNLPAVK
jgi:transglutaminase-like putative cysteine protease